MSIGLLSDEPQAYNRAALPTSRLIERTKTPLGPSMDIVVYERVSQRVVAPIQKRVRRLEMFLVTACVALGCGIWAALHQTAQVERDQLSQIDSVTRLTSSVSNQTSKISEITDSAKDLTNAVTRLAEKQAALFSGQANQARNVEQLSIELRAVQVRTRNAFRNDGADRSAIPASEVRAATVPHHHSYDLSLPIPAGVIIHRADGVQVDYWLVPRILAQDQQQTVRVLPYEGVTSGVNVHNFDDDRDYFLSAADGFLREPIRPLQTQ